MTRWLFARHARSVANEEGWLAGWRDSPLTPQGERDASAFGEHLADRPLERVFTSDLRRARDTARAVANGRLEVVEVEALRERHLGEWEGLRRDVLRADGRLARLMTWEGRPPGGESHRDVALRMLEWLAEVPDAGPTLVVGHGAILRATLGRLDGLPDAEIGTWGLHNLDVVEREVTRERWAALLAALQAEHPP